MEAMGGDLREMQRIPLAPAHVAALREAGAVVQYETGAFLARPGQPIDRFTYVEEGEIEVVNAFTGERLTPSTLGPSHPRCRTSSSRCYPHGVGATWSPGKVRWC